MRTVGALLLVLVLASCAPAAGTPSTASPTTTATTISTVSPTPTASPAPASTAPGASPRPIALPTNVFLAAAGNGVVWAIVASSRLFRSTDRGDTWTERTLPSGVAVGGIAFMNDRDGWILSAGSSGTQCRFQSAVLYRTSDGAATWKPIDPRGIAESQCKDALAFNDATHGYISAWDQNSAPRTYRTADGGATWSASQPIPDPPGYTTSGAGTGLRAGPVADFVAVMFVDATGFQGGREVDYIYRSTDRGAIWSYVTTAPPQGMPVVFLTTTRWIQILLPNVSSETIDAGRTWHAFATDYGQAAPVAPQIVFGDANTGYATVRGSIQRTTDGGAHWTYIKTPGTQQ